MISGFSGFPKFRQLVSASGRAPVQATLRAASATAATYGLDDRGRLAPGLLADVNVIDHNRLRLHPPRMVHDLPAGGRRLLQDVDGYRATVKSGEVTFENGEWTGTRPGRILRSR